MNFDVKRCEWVGTDPIYIAYHDKEWGKPVYEDQKLFEFLVLDTFQAGLSWITILKKRENFRDAFDRFDAEKIANYTEEKVQELLQNKGIIRNQLKIRATITNAQGYLEIQKEFGSFSSFIWGFVGGKPYQNAWKTMQEVPTSTPESDAMSKSLKKRGFKFVGTTICYAFMQAAGLVNDHTSHCFLYEKYAAPWVE
jgi:DNA-3-methyladenine glycosylase I